MIIYYGYCIISKLTGVIFSKQTDLETSMRQEREDDYIEKITKTIDTNSQQHSKNGKQGKEIQML